MVVVYAHIRGPAHFAFPLLGFLLASAVCLVAPAWERVLGTRARMAANEISKVYVAKVRGAFPSFRVTVDAPIGVRRVRKQSNAVLYGVDHSQNGKHARTDFVRRSYDPISNLSVIECYP